MSSTRKVKSTIDFTGKMAACTHAYLGRCEHGNVVWWRLDDSSVSAAFKRNVKADLGHAAMDGLSLQRVTMEESQKTLLAKKMGCEECRALRAAREKRGEQ